MLFDDTKSIISETIGQELITNLQIRAARALLGWSQTRLAEEAGVSVITVKRLEASLEGFHARFDIVMKVKVAVERAGVVFLDGADGFSHGVQLRTS
jgi:DNA-binding XRE family transcriptional regulator